MPISCLPTLFSSFCCCHSHTFLYFVFILHLTPCLCSLHSFDRRHLTLCLTPHWPPSLFLSFSSFYIQCDSLLVHTPVYPLSACMHIEETIPSFITAFKLHGASSSWSPYLTHSVPCFNAVINKKSVLEAFSYIITNKPTLWFVGVCWWTIKKLTNNQLPYGFYSVTDWNPGFSEGILALWMAAVLCGNFLPNSCSCWITESLPFHLPPRTLAPGMSDPAWWGWAQSGSWAATSLCFVDDADTQQSPSGSQYTCTGIRPKHSMFMAAFQSGSSPKYLDLGKMVKYYTSQWLSSLVFAHCLSNRASEFIFESWGKHWQ